MTSKSGSSKQTKKRPKVWPTDDAHSLARYVSPNKLQKDAAGNTVGVLHTAFLLRKGETYLSASCVETAGQPRITGLSALKRACSNVFKDLTRSAFTTGKIEDIKRTCSARSQIRAMHEPKSWNKDYVAVRQFFDDRLDILELLASSSWADWIKVRDIP